MIAEKRKDPLTGQEFQPKKKSQRFATPTNRIFFNNLKAAKVRDQKSAWDNALRKNFLILKELMGNEKVKTFHRMFLQGKGFSFHVNTGTDKFQDVLYWGVYNYLWLSLENDQIKIVAK